ncbi:demethoxyubiquinone hydroxylase family protein [Pararhodospirillum oryzae]|uniref:3-demethoxyubiquinol 3-hydroxylase n=1 Tax=Pararhodospirillum oryzae TaxID=478448 RepID=A0A512H6J5_9PROT|nr:demethoxyubiquinone hydroxylase family protein [Pararhodospirillum oryzae]GEO81073.1 2-nonaprenyl-3-methyl-6-methoxy-1,4-benzoquinol hydroxylase [Pararhodospirillum oryzae]
MTVRRSRATPVPEVFRPSEEDVLAQVQGRLTRRGRRPGDLPRAALVDRVLRVDQAGEYGAVRIYQGQHAVMARRRSPKAAVVAGMRASEERHLATFNALMVERRARPTLLAPLWHVAGFALGAGTALLGDEMAMACTTAVEEVIDDHYRAQADSLGDDELPLKATLAHFRLEEVHHRDQGLAHGAEQAPAYPLVSEAIKAGTRVAIWLSERL